jgi:hypothetical protein
MLTSPTRSKKLHRWRISRLRATPAEVIGYVGARGQEGAIEAAIREYGITDTWKQKRLLAQRVK